MLDPDVQSERVKVSRIAETRNLNKNQNAIFIHNLRKVYFGRGSVPTKVAVTVGGGDICFSSFSSAIHCFAITDTITKQELKPSC